MYAYTSETERERERERKTESESESIISGPVRQGLGRSAVLIAAFCPFRASGSMV